MTSSRLFHDVITFVLGGLALAVEGPSKAEIRCKNNKDGTCDVTYYPTAPGEYKIIVKFDNKNISGSPFTVKVTGTYISGRVSMFPSSAHTS